MLPIKTRLDWVKLVYLLVHFFLMVLGGAIAFLNFRWAEPIGLGLLTGGISGYIVFGYVLVSHDVSERLDVLRHFGIQRAYESRATRIRDEYEQRLSKAKERIDVLAFGLSALREDFGEDFADWKSRAEVRILLIDPDYPAPDSFADQRDREEGRPAGTIRSDVNTFLEFVAPLRGDRFRVRLYTCLPHVNVFRVDDEMFWGPYLVKEQGRNTPTFVSGKGVMFDSLLQHFERIWNDPTLSRDAPPADDPNDGEEAEASA